MICKLAHQVVKQMERPTQDDSMDILKYVKVKRVPGLQLWVKNGQDSSPLAIPGELSYIC